MAEASSQNESLPWLIQGGMGIAISGWPLARAVSSMGQLGVVSGTAIDNVFVRRLQDDGIDDELRRALERFPRQRVVDDIIARFGSTRRTGSTPYRSLPALTHRSAGRSIDAIVLASFIEVTLAKMGHRGIVGINLLTKVQLPTAPALCGAILAGVDYVLMGAGVPTHIPGVLEQLTRGEPVVLPLSVTGARATTRPRRFISTPLPICPRTRSSDRASWASSRRTCSRRPSPSAAMVPSTASSWSDRPRAVTTRRPGAPFGVDDEGNPQYGERDVVDFDVWQISPGRFGSAGASRQPSTSRSLRPRRKRRPGRHPLRLLQRVGNGSRPATQGAPRSEEPAR